MDGEMTQVADPQITTVETIITNDDLESDAVGEVIEAETYTDDFEVSLKNMQFRQHYSGLQVGLRKENLANSQAVRTID